MTAAIPVRPTVRQASGRSVLGSGASTWTTQRVDYGREEWITSAKCRGTDPESLFVRGAQQRKAAIFCRDCPVKQMCLAEALDNRIEFGVWGGLTERQRRALLRKNPGVADWAVYLATGGELVGI